MHYHNIWLFGRFGKPTAPTAFDSIVDQDFQMNQVISLKMLEITHELSIANSHEENGVVEVGKKIF